MFFRHSLSVLSVLILSGCVDVHRPDDSRNGEQDSATKQFTVLSGNPVRSIPDGSAIRYYVSGSDRILTAKITDGKTELAVPAASDTVVCVIGGQGIGECTPNAVTVFGAVPEKQSGNGADAVFVSRSAVSADTLRFFPVTAQLSFSVSGSKTRTVSVSAPGGHLANSSGKYRIDFIRPDMSTSAHDKPCDSIVIPISTAGQRCVSLLPDIFPNGLRLDCLDAEGSVVSTFSTCAPFGLDFDIVPYLGIIDQELEIPEQKEPVFIEDNSLVVTGIPERCRLFFPFTVSVSYPDKDCRTRIISEDGTFDIDGMTLVPTATGRHVVTVLVEREQDTWLYRHVELEEYGEATIAMFVKTRDGQPSTYGNSDVAIELDYPMELAVTFGMTATAERSVGKDVTATLFDRKDIMMRPGESVAVTDYSTLEGLVRQHLLASYSIDITLLCNDGYTEVHFDAENIRKNLEKANKSVTVRLNGERIW